MNMKKLLKSLLAITAAFLMVFSLGTAVNADTTNSLTINNTGNTTHTFELYQIFTGTYSNGILSDIQCGSGISNAGKTALGDAATKAKDAVAGTDSNDAKATAFVNSVKLYLTNATTSTSVEAGSSYKFDNLTAGYYLVKDVDNSQKDGIGAYTSYIVQVVGSVTQDTKLDVPTVVKKVKDTNDSTDETTDWQDSADYDIKDSVPYQITGTMPSNIDKYTTYKYVFTDTMSKGLTYTANTATIKIGDTDVTTSFTETVTSNTDGSTTVTWSCDNLKGIRGVTLNANSTVIVTYNCTLNDKAVIGSAGNPNTVNLTFSNNPNQGGEGETGKTPDDKNIVFTYKVVVNKFDQDKKSLAGAAFKLEKKNSDGSYKTVMEYTAGTETSFGFTGLDDGDYRLTETTTPAGYNTITPIEFTISAEHDKNSYNPALTKLSGNAASGEITFTADMSAGSLTTDVVNEKGSNLPSTGGIGTTIFYVCGGSLVAIAAALLIAKKRASAE